jgi:hypothetical protein
VLGPHRRLTIRAKVDHLDSTIQAPFSRTAHLNMAGYDTLGACIFAGFGFAAALGVIRDLLNARYGWEAARTSSMLILTGASHTDACLGEFDSFGNPA